MEGGKANKHLYQGEILATQYPAGQKRYLRKKGMKTMKKMKKLFALVLSFIMVLSMGTMAFAAESDGSITIRNATVGENYAAYKVFDLTYSGDNVSYSYTKQGDGDAFLTALQGEGSPFKLTETSEAGKYNVQATGTADAISTWLTTNKALLGNAVASTPEGGATSATVTFDNLPYGYYYITSTTGSVVTIDSAMPNVTVIDKNQGPSWDNEPEKPGEGEDPNPGKVIVNADGTKTTVNSANFGDTVNFSISVNATAYAGDELVTYYYITDTLGDGFAPAENIVVKVGDQVLTKGTEYTLTTNGQKFDIAIPFGEKYGSNAKIEVTYSAVVENDAVIAGDGNKNTANFTYDTKEIDPDDPDAPTTPDKPGYPEETENPKYDDNTKKETTTYVYALGIKKVDPKGNVLTGAKFSVEGITAKATETAGVYEYDKNGTVTEFETDDNGILIIKGLAAGEYSITETVAPDGYNLLPDSITVEAELAGSYTTTITTYYDTEGNVVTQDKADLSKEPTETDVKVNVVPYVVVNQTGTELPSTGGIGTTIFYVLGGILLLGAAVVMISRRRMRAE